MVEGRGECTEILEQLTLIVVLLTEDINEIFGDLSQQLRKLLLSDRAAVGLQFLEGHGKPFIHSTRFQQFLAVVHKLVIVGASDDDSLEGLFLILSNCKIQYLRCLGHPSMFLVEDHSLLCPLLCQVVLQDYAQQLPQVLGFALREEGGVEEFGGCGGMGEDGHDVLAIEGAVSEDGVEGELVRQFVFEDEASHPHVALCHFLHEKHNPLR
jgi:hypothetical protein